MTNPTAPTPGHVYLIGAGPGDPGLITRAGLEALQQADVVIHDRLVHPNLIADAPPQAQRIDVGKRPGKQVKTQDQTNQLIVDHALQGSTVARLKGGDPYVFGRGDEERQACIDANVPVTVIPGITSAIAASAAANIPVTRRGIARTFAIFTPRTGTAEPLNTPDYAALAKLDTLCIYMGIGDIESIATNLIAAGKPPTTPVAVIRDGTLPTQTLLTATLDTVTEAINQANITPPAIITIGDTAAMATEPHNPQQPSTPSRPLSGKTIVVTRPIRASRRIAAKLKAHGANVIESPLIRIDYLPHNPKDPQAIDPITQLKAHNWLVFTSLHSVIGYERHLNQANTPFDARLFANHKFAAVGPKTADQLFQSFKVHADIVPTEHRATALIAELTKHLTPQDNILFPCGTLALDELPQSLANAGIPLTQRRVYDTIPTPLSSAAAKATEESADAILLYAPSAVRALADSNLNRLTNNTNRPLIGAIGPTTADALHAANLPCDFIPETYSDDGMTQATIDALQPDTANNQPANHQPANTQSAKN